MRALILGSGPTAAFCYRACRDAGLGRSEVFVWSQTGAPTQPSAGAFFIHDVPFSVRDRAIPYQISILTLGTEQVYTEKQWENPTASSFPGQDHLVTGYDPEQVLPLLWEEAWHIRVQQMTDLDILNAAVQADIVFQTFPCEISKKFMEPYVVWPQAMSIKKLSRQSVLDLGLDWYLARNSFNYLLYNGLEGDGWVRCSRLFGSDLTLEFPAGRKVVPVNAQVYRYSLFPDLSPDTPVWDSPLSNNIILLGRSALWDRKFLTHHAYRKTMDALKHYTLNSVDTTT